MKWLDLTTGVIMTVAQGIIGAWALTVDNHILAFFALIWCGVTGTMTATTYFLFETVKSLEKYDFILKEKRSSDS